MFHLLELKKEWEAHKSLEQTNKKQTNNDQHCLKKDLYKMTLVGGKGCLMQFGWWVASYYYCCSNKHCNDVTKAHLVLLQTCCCITLGHALYPLCFNLYTDYESNVWAVYTNILCIPNF